MLPNSRASAKRSEDVSWLGDESRPNVQEGRHKD